MSEFLAERAIPNSSNGIEACDARSGGGTDRSDLLREGKQNHDILNDFPDWNMRRYLNVHMPTGLR